MSQLYHWKKKYKKKAKQYTQFPSNLQSMQMPWWANMGEN